MRNIILIFAVMLNMNTQLVFSATSVRDSVIELLPNELTQLSAQISDKELKAQFAKKIIASDEEDIPDENTIYLQYFQNKNDVTIGINEGKLDYVYIEVPRDIQNKSKSLFSSVLRHAIVRSAKQDHEAGRYIVLDFPHEKLTLKFHSNKARDLHSVILWSTKRKSP